MQEQRIYLDFNATTPPIAPEVAAAINSGLTEPFGNPSSEHWEGLPARQAVQKGTGASGGIIELQFATEVVFTSGGSEANNHALKGG